MNEIFDENSHFQLSETGRLVTFIYVDTGVMNELIVIMITMTFKVFDKQKHTYNFSILLIHTHTHYRHRKQSVSVANFHK